MVEVEDSEEMAQTFITSYFSNRKRKGDEIKNRKKVLVLDRRDSDVDVPIIKEVRDIRNVFGLGTSEASHSVNKDKDISEDYANKLIHVKIKPVPCESQGRAPEKYSAQKSSQGRSKKIAFKPSKDLGQCDIRQILLKTNGTEAHDKAHPVNGTSLKTVHTSAEHGTFLVRLCPH
jgi:hypothetical protein